MSNILFDISGKIETSYVNALLAIKEIADYFHIPFFVIGATARDFLMFHSHNIKAPRMTTDIDLGVKIPGWDTFKALTDAMLASGKFIKAKEKQRYVYNDVIIDIIPFGRISDEDKRIKWPPEHEIILSTLGFDEAYKFSVLFKLSMDPPLEVKVPTLPGLAMMKLISWNENYPGRKKDAEDLLFIIENYVEVVDQNDLYEKEALLLEEVDFDNQIACTRLLGKEMANLSTSATLNKINEILVRETSERSNYRLISNMLKPRYDFDKILFLLNKLKQGISDKK